MSLDGDRSPLIETEEILPTDDSMSILDEKVIGADDGILCNEFKLTLVEAIMEKHLPVLPDLETLHEGSDTWHILDWRALERKAYGPSWKLGGFTWRLLLFPLGNTAPDSCAAYLECSPSLDSDDNDKDWSCCAQFAICMWNKNDPTIYSSHSMTSSANVLTASCISPILERRSRLGLLETLRYTKISLQPRKQ